MSFNGQQTTTTEAEVIASFAIAFDSANGNLYVANAGGNTISVISGKTNTVFGSPIPVGLAQLTGTHLPIGKWTAYVNGVNGTLTISSVDSMGKIQGTLVGNNFACAPVRQPMYNPRIFQ